MTLRARRGHRLIAGLQALLIVASMLAPVAALAAEIQTDLWVYNDGDTVTVTGVDFGPAETVELVTTDPFGTLVDRGTTLTDAAGGLTYQFVLTLTSGGIYDIVATGQTSGLVATTQFDPAFATVSPLSIAFGNVAVGSSSAAQTVSITNTGTTNMNVQSATLIGLDTSQFSVAVTPQNGIAPGQAITMTVTFSPTTVGAKTASVEIETNANNPVVALSGTGVAANQPPVANPDSPTVDEDSVGNVIPVLANDTDPNGDTLDVTGVGPAAHGTSGFTATAATYSPAPNACGTDSFTYTITDNHGGTASSTVTVDVTCLNDGPVASDDAATVGEDSGSNPIDVLLNDTDVDAGTVLEVTTVSQGAKGGVVFTSSGVTYTPDGDACGDDAFTYTISDGDGGTATATVDVTISCVNDGPTAVDDGATVTEDDDATPIDVLANDTDPDTGDAQTVIAVGPATVGTTAFTPGGVTYEPDPDACGSDTFTYTIQDAAGLTSAATVDVTVTCLNDAPVADADVATVLEDSGPTSIDVLANDDDVEGDSLTVVAVSQGSLGSVAIDAGGGSVSYTPADDACGSDTVSYTISDDNGGTASATVSVTITCVNDAPTAVDQIVAAVEDDVDVEISLGGSAGPANESGQALAFVLVGGPSHGTLSETAAGPAIVGGLPLDLADVSLFYTPAPDFCGADAITFRVRDDGGTLDGGADTSGLATVSLDVACVNDAPVVTITSGPSLVDEDQAGGESYEFSVVDADVGDTFGLLASSPSCGTSGGQLIGDVTVLPAGGGFVCRFADGPAFPIVSVQVFDGAGEISNLAILDVEVRNVDPTVSVTGPADVDEGGTATFTIAVSDPGADTFVLDAVDCGSLGLEVGAGSVDATTGAGSFTCAFADDDPTGTPSDLASVSGTVSDDDAGSDSGSASITVHNLAPAAAIDGPTTGDEGSEITLSGSFIDAGLADSHVLGWAVVASTGQSIPTGLGPTFAFTPADDGTFTVTLTVTDDDGGQDVVDHVLTIANVAPRIALSGAATTPEGATYSLTLGAIDDPGADTVGEYVVHWGDGTTESFATAGIKTHVYPDGPADHTITVDLVDEDGAFPGAGTLAVHVDNVDPTALILGATTPRPEGVSINLTGAAGDVTADAPTLVLGWTVTKDGNPYATGGNTAAFGFTPDDNGTYVVTLTVTDKDGGVGTNVRTIVVTNQPPAPSIGGAPATGPEGTPIALTASATDPSTVDTAAGFTFGWSVTKNGSPYATGSGPAFSFTPDDDGTYVVSLTATDKDGGVGSTTASITATNVAPELTGATIGWNPFTHTATVTAGFTDAGTADTHGAPPPSFAWNEAGIAGPTVVSQAAGGGTVSGSLVLGPGCYDLAVAVTVHDDDGAQGTAGGSFVGSADAYDIQFRAPIKDGERNLAKNNSVVPVKIVVASLCNAGATITSEALFVTIAAGGSSDIDPDDPNVIVTNVNSPDTNQRMRVVDGGYLYNLSTKGLANTTDYTLRIRLTGTAGEIVKKAVLRTYK